ncbi:TPA: hypothetical protein EYO57_18405 [Candidatus Poribacteria bacterium]|jgi:predicted DNA-binding WGR domain protein|nr:hypothetical protein [Candidatus Poribacteria bacterium]
MELDLYVANMDLIDLNNWVTKISAAAKTQGFQIEYTAIQISDLKLIEEPLSVILDELCCQPEYQIKFQVLDPSLVSTYVYKSYQSLLAEGENICFYLSAENAIFVPFDHGCLARKVAHLYYQEEMSNKIYHLYLTHLLGQDSYQVISRYGGQGKSLHQASRSFDDRLGEAEREWNRLYRSKVVKGYKIVRPEVSNQLALKFPFPEAISGE